MVGHIVEGRGAMRRHLIFVGLPGSGKSTVGGQVAETLGAEFVDLDAWIERRTGLPVARIITEQGEPHFRAIEREAMRDALAEPPCVISPGGGWVAQPGAIEEAQSRGFIIYLQALVSTAVDRLDALEERPLMAAEDPLERMRTLLRQREPYFTRAHCTVKTDRRPLEAVVDEVAELARERADW